MYVYILSSTVSPLKTPTTSSPRHICGITTVMQATTAITASPGLFLVVFVSFLPNNSYPAHIDRAFVLDLAILINLIKVINPD